MCQLSMPSLIPCRTGVSTVRPNMNSYTDKRECLQKKSNNNTNASYVPNSVSALLYPSNMSMRHYSCVALCFVNICQKGLYELSPWLLAAPCQMKTANISNPGGSWPPWRGVFSSYLAIVQTELDWRMVILIKKFDWKL